MVTLRGEKMYEFLDRLINIALPRVRDFRGVPAKAFDGRGNYTLGIRDHLIFPEIDVAKVDKSKGMNITIVTTREKRRTGPLPSAGAGHAVRQEVRGKTMAKMSMIVKAERKPKFMTRKRTAARCADARAAFCGSFSSAASASGSFRSAATSPASPRQAGKGKDRSTNVNDRPDRGHADPHPQRNPVASRSRRASRVEAEGGDRKILKSEGFISNYKLVEEGQAGDAARLSQVLDDGEPVIHGIERISRPGRRVYRNKKEIPSVLGGLGLAIVSTSKGVLAGHEAAKNGIGGEVLCQVW